ncbi:MAG TPA: hypothetical protein VLH10_17150 [Yinghuangia sp.]|uniref:hypothetical protein n=1 Tax=Yinghuangia sp. YIM S10712 TaxID=3436930 RepID=UPI002BE3CC09|nr:hypothetical protein [Yinghuangia sp.]
MADAALPNTALLLAHALQWVDTDTFPWVVEVVFHDADGNQHTLIDKVPLFADMEDLHPGLALPVGVRLGCRVLGAASGNRFRVAIDHRSVHDDGQAEFTVSPDQLTAETTTGNSAEHVE